MRHHIRILCFTVLLASILAASGLGQVRQVPLGTEPGNNQFGSSLQNVAALPDGRFAAVWVRSQGTPTRAGIYLQLVRPDGTFLLDPSGQPVTEDYEISPLVVPQAREGVLMAWQHINSLGQSQIFVQWMDDQGHPRWGAGTFAATSVRYEFSSGLFCWRAPMAAPSPASSARSPVSRASPTSLASGSAPTDGGSEERDVIVQRVNGAGRGLWGSGVVIPPASSYGQTLGSLIPGPDGGVFVGIVNFGPGNGLRFQRLSDDGRLLWPEGGVPASDRGYNFSCAGAYDGGVLRFACEGYGSNVHVGALDLEGNHLTLPLSDFAGDSLGGLALDPGSGASLVVWNHDISETDAEVLGAIYSLPR